ncbi:MULTISPECIES: arginine--tRNA ligase [unclassified Luteibacter]|uniref:arginine--tRNA ligase n=1 Tax=Luteibacter sp. PvP019 TaxID=3156436 RepID=UPI003394D5CE
MCLSPAASVDALLSVAFVSLDLPATQARAVPASRPDLGDFQCNGAFSAAAATGRSPRDTAEALAACLRAHAMFDRVSVTGAGFINLRLADAFIAERLAAMAADPRLGVADEGRGREVILDFGGPNVAKPLHVGHLRSLVLGESLRRIHAALGWRTHADAHLGDWGLQMGMLSAAIRRLDPGLPFFRTGATSPFPAQAPVTLDALERLYPDAAAACRSDPARMAEARADTAALQAGDAGLMALWRSLRALSLAAQVEDFAMLGVHFDALDGESDVRDAVAPLVQRLLDAGVAHHSEGAVVVDVARADDTVVVPPLLLAKRDGAALYATTDLATLEARASRPDLARVVYVVDQRQALHFEQVFRAARKAGIGDHLELVHVGFGTVNGTDGKPFRTRDGGVARLADLLEAAMVRAGERLDAAGYGTQGDDAQHATLARQVGIAAVRFADLSGDRLSGYVFDTQRMVAFEGRTGPYLQYACVRMRALLARASDAAAGPATPVLALERDLALACLSFGDAVAEACLTCQPGVLAAFAHALAQRFSRFYAECPVLAEPDGATRASRLALCVLTERVLARSLHLLGIEVPARM